MFHVTTLLLIQHRSRYVMHMTLCCNNTIEKLFPINMYVIIITSFYSLWSIGHPWRASRHCDLQLSPWPHSMIFLFLLFHPLLSFATFSSAYLFFYIPDDSNLMLFSLLLLLLCVVWVQSNSIFIFLFGFLLASVGWFSIVLCFNLIGPFYTHNLS
jgi:hypothetical protein